MRGWDYIAIGTMGFAQVGTPHYQSRIKVEKLVISTYYETTDSLKIPTQFQYYAHFKWVQCPHDFGTYWDYQLFYDRDAIETLEISDGDEDQELFEQFWRWANHCETSINTDVDILLKWCYELYLKEITMEIVHRDMNDKFNGLKAV